MASSNVFDTYNMRRIVRDDDRYIEVGMNVAESSVQVHMFNAENENPHVRFHISPGAAKVLLRLLTEVVGE
jgi:hypothetical protein